MILRNAQKRKLSSTRTQDDRGHYLYRLYKGSRSPSLDKDEQEDTESRKVIDKKALIIVFLFQMAQMLKWRCVANCWPRV